MGVNEGWCWLLEVLEVGVSCGWKWWLIKIVGGGE